MTALKRPFRNTVAAVLCFLLSTSCSATNTKSEINLIGSTPGDELIKTMFSIPAETKVDFMRWDLILGDGNSFVLKINYGECQPNTLGFIKDGKKEAFKGTFSVLESSNFKEVYHLKSSDLFAEIRIAKLNDNIFHLLTPQNKMMVGNGGWSYSLNRSEPVRNNEISIASTTTNSQSLQLVYDGRTPCQEFADEHPEMRATPSCFKLKWRLVLYRDSITHQPTACAIRNIVDNQPRDILGRWEIVKGTATNPNAIIYKIKADSLLEPISFFAGDENVLFFLDKNNEPMIGNEDFSFTMNKRREDSAAEK